MRLQELPSTLVCERQGRGDHRLRYRHELLQRRRFRHPVCLLLLVLQVYMLRRQKV
jgi:hypothetical protein